MDNKLVVVVMGQNCENHIGMCLNSIKDADGIIYCDGGSNDKSKKIVSNFMYQLQIKRNFLNKNIIENKWNSDDKAMNGKQRNFYLNHIKENYQDYWCLAIDADEILDDNGIKIIKQFINERKPGIYNVKMRHFIGDIGHEDAIKQVHVVPGRLFKISEAIKYPEHSHPVLEGELMGACLDTTIWHLGHCPILYLDYIKNRYEQHLSDSIIHTPEFLKNWYYAHIFGEYPTRQVNPIELPKQLLKRYNINPDEFYFQNRGIEVKHFIDIYHWKEYFKLGDKNGI